MRVPVSSWVRSPALTLGLAASVALAGPSVGQAGAITGTVSDQATGRPLAGARIRATTQQVAGLETADSALRAVPFQLEEIVTTATGDQQSRELGNSVSKIQTAQLVETDADHESGPGVSGRIGGVNVLQSAGTSGTGGRVRIRGLSSVSLSNDPLLYIEGIRVAADAPAGAFVGGPVYPN